MGIYIKGIKVPAIVKVHYLNGRRYVEDPQSGEWREMVEIPPHGRLVDADKLGIRDAEKQAYEAYLREKGEDFIEEPIIEYHRGYLEGLTHASGLVRFAPTIIPAEEKT